MTGRIWKRTVGGVGVLLFCIVLLGPGQGVAKEKRIVHDDLFSVSFPTKRDGWACGRFGTILHTCDGGLTWERQESGTTYTLTSIEFVDPLNGWAVGNKGTILRTRDGGKTWEKQESPVDSYHMCVEFLTAERGFVVGERTRILATEDGGRTWRVRFEDEDFILKSISFCDDLHGWAVGEFGYTYHTGDGGQRWEKQTGLYELDEETGSLKGGTFLYDVVALDPDTAWVVGIQGVVKVTRDGGKTWEEPDLRLPPVQLYAIGFDGVDTLVIGGRGVCVVSNDRGAHWQEARFDPPLVYSWVYGMCRVGEGSLAACGDEGAIYLMDSEGWHGIAY